jgi:hypothetical protein
LFVKIIFVNIKLPKVFRLDFLVFLTFNLDFSTALSLRSEKTVECTAWTYDMDMGQTIGRIKTIKKASKCFTALHIAKFLVPDLGDKVDSGIVCRDGPSAYVAWWTGGPYARVVFIPLIRDYELGLCTSLFQIKCLPGPS